MFILGPFRCLAWKEWCIHGFGWTVGQEVLLWMLQLVRARKAGWFFQLLRNASNWFSPCTPMVPPEFQGRQWQHAEQLLWDGQAQLGFCGTSTRQLCNQIAEAAGLRLDAIGFSAATSACEKGWHQTQSDTCLAPPGSLLRGKWCVLFDFFLGGCLSKPLNRKDSVFGLRQWSRALQMLQEMRHRRLLEAY